MEQLVGFEQLPDAAAKQITQVVAIWKKHMGEQLVGVYLHGSIVLNAFHPDSGDIDILVVVKDSFDQETKLAIAKDIIEIDRKPCPLEMSAVRLQDVKPWKNPGNCVFHYSDFWTQKYLERFANPSAECYVVDQEFPDADVTSYIRLIRQCGIVLFGEKIENVFSEISDEDFFAAISADVDDYDFYDYDPRYFASNILILGRILSFKVTGKILSKYDAGLWMIDSVPAALKYLPERAMKTWYEGKQEEFPQEDLEKLREYLVYRIKN